MRRLLLFILICWPLLFAGSICNVVVGQGASAGTKACQVLQSYTNDSNHVSVFNTTDYYYCGFRITPGSNTEVCKVTFKMTAQGTISGKTFTAYIYTMTGSNLNAVQATSEGVTGNNSWSATEVDFTFSTPFTMQASTEYAVCYSMGEVDATNYVTNRHNGTEDLDSVGYTIWNSAKARSADYGGAGYSIAYKLWSIQ